MIEIINKFFAEIVQTVFGSFLKILKNIPRKYIVHMVSLAYVILSIITVILFLPDDVIRIFGFAKISEYIGDYRGIFAVFILVVFLFLLYSKICKIRKIKRIVNELDLEELIMLHEHFYKTKRNMAMLNEDSNIVSKLEMKGVIIKMIDEAMSNWNAVHCKIDPDFKKAVYKRLKNFKIPKTD
jgi:hypothetical protein